MPEVVKKPKPPFERSAETGWCVAVLDKLEIGDTATYEDINKACGCDVQENRHILQSSRRILLNEKSKLFDCIRNVGVKRLDDAGVLGAMRYTRVKIARYALKGRRMGECIEEPDQLSASERGELFAHRSLFGLIRATLKEKRVGQIKEAAKSRELNWSEMLKALNGAKE